MENPFTVTKRKCILCQHGITPDYKNVKLLSQFISPHTGRVYGRHITGLCKDQQDRLENEISKSRFAGRQAQLLIIFMFLSLNKMYLIFCFIFFRIYGILFQTSRIFQGS